MKIEKLLENSDINLKWKSNIINLHSFHINPLKGEHLWRTMIKGVKVNFRPNIFLWELETLARDEG